MPMVSLDMMLWKRANCPNICRLASFSRRASGDRPSQSPRSFSICWTLILLRYCKETAGCVWERRETGSAS